MKSPRVIELTEYDPNSLPSKELSWEEGEIIYKNYRSLIDIQFPSPKTSNQWRLKSQGYVGYIPIISDLAILMKPKVKLSNLFRMWEWAYRLKFEFLKGLMECQSIQEYFSLLARELSLRILERTRKGLYRAYVEAHNRLMYVRGRVDSRNALRISQDLSLICCYEDHTPNIQDNQILAWTLRKIAQSGFCSEKVLSSVRQASRTIQGSVALIPFNSASCVSRDYNRLNQDYEELHTLCRFFLDQSGPSHNVGHQIMIPFIVNMARLFELFVAEWLKANPPLGFVARPKESLKVGENEALRFEIDIVLYDALTDKPVCVIDTKYKRSSRPEQGDIFQIVTYAVATGTHDAILVYPAPLDEPLDKTIGDIRVRSLTFSLDGDLDDAGHLFNRMISDK